MNIEQAIGAELRAMRTEKGMSQERLGFEASLHRTYISLIERGVKSPTISTTIRICRALDVAPDVFIRRAMERLNGKRR